MFRFIEFSKWFDILTVAPAALVSVAVTQPVPR